MDEIRHNFSKIAFILDCIFAVFSLVAVGNRHIGDMHNQQISMKIKVRVFGYISDYSMYVYVSNSSMGWSIIDMVSFSQIVTLAHPAEQHRNSCSSPLKQNPYFLF